MPSIVSAARSLLARIDWNATATVSPSCMATVPPAPLAARAPAAGVVVCRMPGMPPPVMVWIRFLNSCCELIRLALGSTSTESPALSPEITSL